MKKKTFGQMFVLICTKKSESFNVKNNPGLDTQLNPFDNKPLKVKGLFFLIYLM